jgi:aminopeptidase N
MDTVSVSAFNNPMSLYRASAPRLWNIIHTRVALSFDYANRTANGEEWLTLQPYFYPTDTLVLDAKSMKIESVSIGHGDKLLKFRYDSTNLFIQLDKIYSKDDLVKLNIKYVAMPYAFKTGGSAAITDDRGLYFINHDGKLEGKPIQIWTQGETEANSHWLPTIDKPNSRTTIQIELTVPAQFKTLSNGELISSADKGIMRTDIWKMDKPIQIYAIMFAIGDFAIAKDKIYIVTSIGDVWVLISNKKSLKTYKINFDDNK